MGMLSNKELAEALVTNLDNWDWSINSKYGVDEATGKALVEEYRALQIRCKGLEKRIDANKLLAGTM